MVGPPLPPVVSVFFSSSKSVAQIICPASRALP
jgi:hypothetical protein